MKMIDEIKKALSEAHVPYMIEEKNGDILDSTGNTLADFFYHDEDVHLVANAPDWLNSLIELVKQQQKENEWLMNAIKHAHQSLTWSNTENQVPHAVWYLEQVMPQALKATEQPSEAAAEG